MENKPKEISISEELFLRTKIKGEMDYKNIQSVYCPYFKEKINFNASGLEHIKFRDTKGRPRKKYDQYLRLKLFCFVPDILRTSATLQGIWETNEWERQKKHGKWQSSLLQIKYYEFIAVIGKIRIKIIVKKTGHEGEKFFWSIIPFWKTRESIMGHKRILHDGNPSED